jgi:hypothetical protein
MVAAPLQKESSINQAAFGIIPHRNTLGLVLLSACTHISFAPLLLALAIDRLCDADGYVNPFAFGRV